jgi:hypothetical protein
VVIAIDTATMMIDGGATHGAGRMSAEGMTGEMTEGAVGRDLNIVIEIIDDR